MLPFQVILFDVGGVLLTNSWDIKERAQAAANFHIDQADFQARHAEVSDQWERGGISMATYLDVAVFHEPRNFSRVEFIACMFEQSKLLPNGALGILKELAASGHYLIGALNNEARELNDYRFETFGLREYFELALTSCYLGLRKPDLAIYRRAIDIVGGPPERILFIDDRPENVTGAQAAGLVALRFTGADELRCALSRLDALPEAAQRKIPE